MPAISFIKLKRIIIENSLARTLASAYDAFFRNVVLLLHGNGNNAGQNNTFVDNSANNFAITRNGNVTQGTFSPYGDNWSYYFDGTGDYLQGPSNAAFIFGTGDFTLEYWTYPVSNTTGSMVDLRTNIAGADSVAYSDYLDGTGKLGLYFGANVYLSTSTIPMAQWTYIAVTRSGTSLRVFINGTQDGSTVSNSQNLAGGAPRIGVNINGTGFFSGYISNVRVIKGTAVYTSNFTPPTAPLPVIPNTSLLTCQSNRFRDLSANNFAITRNGDVSVSRFSPFQLTTPYSSGTSGQSVYFDGIGDYLTTPYTPASFDWWTSDFTIEAWVYATSWSSWSGIHNGNNRPSLVGNMAQLSTTNYWSFGPTTTGNLAWYYFNGSELLLSSSGTVRTSQWNHIAATKTSSGITFFINGVAETPIAISGTPLSSNSQPLVIGSHRNISILGYVSNLRIIKGTALYTGNFTPPTAPLTAISNTSLLTCQSNSFIDTSPNNFTITPNGNAAIRLFSPFSSVAQLGSVGGSGYFDGTGDSLTISSAAGLCDFATNEAYTFQVWAYRLSTAEMVFIGSANSFQVGVVNAGVRFSRQNIGDIFFGVGSVPVGAWSHITICRNTSGTTRCWTNGVSAASTTDTGSFALGTTNIGSQTAGTAPTNGYLCDMQIIKGLALYDPTSSANIEIPSAPLTAIPNTSFLLNFTNATIIDNSMMNDLETLGNAQISTSVKKYGSGSLAFDGTGDYLAIQRFENSFNIRTEKFTIEGWFYLTNSTFQVLFASGNTGLGNIYLDTSGTDVYFGDGASNIIIFPTSNIPVNSWFHLAVTFDETTYRIFINGVSVGSSTTLLKNVTLSDFYIAARPGTFNKIMVSGYIDDFRITKGVARYISNFTPPTEQFPDIGAIKVIHQNQIATFSDIEITTFGNDNIFKIT